MDAFKTISNLQRKPSMLDEGPVNVRSPRSPPPPQVEGGVLGWAVEEVDEWLAELGMEHYQSLFREHAVETGRRLVRLREEHLKEMGVVKVGDRLELAARIGELRSAEGLTGDGIDVDSLLAKLDQAKARRFMRRQPKRIILVRHAESVGNIDSTVYAHIPDNKLKVTERGKHQAYAAGQKLKELIGPESVTFYVSPFLRSRQTYEEIRMCFHDEQVLCYREDPRLREQEWGNFQDPNHMTKIMEARRKTGAFYYRFPTGESGADVFDRVSMFLETLYRDMQKGECGQNTLIVTHGLFCRLFLTRYYHWNVQKFHKLWNFENGQYAIMELQPQGYYKLITELKSDP